MSLVRRVALVLVVVGLSAISLTACGSSDEATGNSDSTGLGRVEKAAVEKYRWYLESNVRELVDWTTQLRNQIAVGELAKAQSRYATARVQYGQIEAAAMLFTPLNTRINAQADEVPASKFIGFHRIEKGLFADESTKGLKPVAEQLLDDVKDLGRQIRTTDLGSARVAAGADAALTDIAASELAGKEEPYALTDMADASAGLEGAEAAFEAVRPLLASADQGLVEDIEVQFVEAFEGVGEAGTAAREPQARPAAAGVSFIAYQDFPAAEIRRFKKPVETLSELFEPIPDRLEAIE